MNVPGRRRNFISLQQPQRIFCVLARAEPIFPCSGDSRFDFPRSRSDIRFDTEHIGLKQNICRAIRALQIARGQKGFYQAESRVNPPVPMQEKWRRYPTVDYFPELLQTL